MNIRWYHILMILAAARIMAYGCRAVSRGTSRPRPPETAALKQPSRPSPDFIVGTWKIYAMSDSKAGPKKSSIIERSDSSFTTTFCADGTWQSVISESDRPPEAAGEGTWEKFGDGYLCHEPGEPDSMVFREGEELYMTGPIEDIGDVWFWLRRTTPRQSSNVKNEYDLHKWGITEEELMTPEGED